MEHSTSKTKQHDYYRDHETDVKIVVENSSFGLAIHVSGYGRKEDPDEAPILIENHDGQLRVILWSDINNREPKIIEMGDAELPK